MPSRKSWLEISERVLRRNYAAVATRAAAHGAAVLAVVKADAYGHGAELCAPILASEGATWLGVTDVCEGAEVRRALDRSGTARDTQPHILVMCGLLPGDAGPLVEYQLTPVLWTTEQIAWLQRDLPAVRSIGIHLEIDTGMSRQGVVPGAPLDAFLDRLAEAPGLRLEGVLTHFASAEIAGSPLTPLQQRRFEAALVQIRRRDIHPAWIHAGNSSTIDEAHTLPWLREIAIRYAAHPLVRSGLALYGYCLPLEGAEPTLEHAVEPVLTWKTRILAIEDVPAGATVGYNATFTAPHPMRLALLPLGYADGLRRELSGTDAKPGGWVVIAGQHAPIVGRISMNLTVVDISATPSIAPGDEVALIGEGITAEDHARLAGTITYEILCGMRAERALSA